MFGAWRRWPRGHGRVGASYVLFLFCYFVLLDAFSPPFFDALVVVLVGVVIVFVCCCCVLLCVMVSQCVVCHHHYSCVLLCVAVRYGITVCCVSSLL